MIALIVMHEGGATVGDGLTAIAVCALILGIFWIMFRD